MLSDRALQRIQALFLISHRNAMEVRHVLGRPENLVHASVEIETVFVRLRYPCCRDLPAENYGLLSTSTQCSTFILGCIYIMC